MLVVSDVGAEVDLRSFSCSSIGVCADGSCARPSASEHQSLHVPRASLVPKITLGRLSPLVYLLEPHAASAN